MSFGKMLKARCGASTSSSIGRWEQNEMAGKLRVTYQASPKFMAPMHSGLTLTAAEGESRRCLPRRDFGGGAGSIVCRGVVFDGL